MKESLMDQLWTNTEQASTDMYYGTKQPQVSVTAEENLLISLKGINYYVIDLQQVDINALYDILKGCETVENECWVAQENFFDYIRKCDVLSYAEHKGRIIAFDVVTLLHSRTCCVFSNDETMVLQKYRGLNIARNLVMSTFEWFNKQTSYFHGVSHLVFLSISANPRVVNGYCKNSYTKILFDCSFDPSPELISLNAEYCLKNDIELVDENYPFCLKNMFPGSNTFAANDPKFQFTPKVRKHMPKEFDHMQRGDAFAFMVKFTKAAPQILSTLLMTLTFGWNYISNKKIGWFRTK